MNSILFFLLLSFKNAQVLTILLLLYVFSLALMFFKVLSIEFQMIVSLYFIYHNIFFFIDKSKKIKKFYTMYYISSFKIDIFKVIFLYFLDASLLVFAYIIFKDNIIFQLFIIHIFTCVLFLLFLIIYHSFKNVYSTRKYF